MSLRELNTQLNLDCSNHVIALTKRRSSVPDILTLGKVTERDEMKPSVVFVENCVWTLVKELRLEGNFYLWLHEVTRIV
ncbi:hypothetical protein PsorP6_013837 [Peronosclerospora sorghi]|uniref:Uncharacterized protein n=1 Tax=Peronosclerospora sorghi TaxID=230839 RepID=A0ACC0VI39_9STRA|nr:hypothetical protein PsorP6_013837 [Peronosclerospora sorghi]